MTPPSEQEAKCWCCYRLLVSHSPPPPISRPPHSRSPISRLSRAYGKDLLMPISVWSILFPHARPLSGEGWADSGGQASSSSSPGEEVWYVLVVVVNPPPTATLRGGPSRVNHRVSSICRASKCTVSSNSQPAVRSWLREILMVKR